MLAKIFCQAVIKELVNKSMFAVKIRSGVTNALFKRSVSDYGTPYTAKNRLEERERVLKKYNSYFSGCKLY